MGIGGISPIQLIIILVIVLLIFGTKKLRGFGGDLGGAIKGFKKAMKDGDSEDKGEAGGEEKEELDDAARQTADAAREKTGAETEDAKADNNKV